MSHFCFQCGEGLTGQTEEGRVREVCPRCGWIHYPQLKVGAGVLLEQDGGVFLVQRKTDPWQGAWYLPAGFVEVDEPPEQAAAREILEETGLQVEISGLVDVYFFDDDPRGNGLFLLYRARPVSGRLHTTPEAAQMRYFQPDEIPENLTGGGHDRAIRAWQQRIHR